MGVDVARLVSRACGSRACGERRPRRTWGWLLAPPSEGAGPSYPWGTQILPSPVTQRTVRLVSSVHPGFVRHVGSRTDQPHKKPVAGDCQVMKMRSVSSPGFSLIWFPDVDRGGTSCPGPSFALGAEGYCANMYGGGQAWQGALWSAPSLRPPPVGALPGALHRLSTWCEDPGADTVIESVTGTFGTSHYFFSWICPPPPALDWPRGWRSGGEAHVPQICVSLKKAGLAQPGSGSHIGVERTQVVNHFFAKQPAAGAPCT